MLVPECAPGGRMPLCCRIPDPAKLPCLKAEEECGMFRYGEIFSMTALS